MTQPYAPHTAVRKWIQWALETRGMTPEDLVKRIGGKDHRLSFISSDEYEQRSYRVSTRDLYTLGAVSKFLGADKDFLRRVWEGEQQLYPDSFKGGEPERTEQFWKRPDQRTIREKLADKSAMKARQEALLRVATVENRERTLKLEKAHLEARLETVEHELEDARQRLARMEATAFGGSRRATG